MGIRLWSLLCFATVCLASAPMESRAGDAVELYLGAGASGASISNFRGGSGVVLGVELPAATHANILIRADYHSVPEQADGAVVSPPHAMGWFGDWPEGARAMKAMSLLLGLRVHAPPGRVATYVDALVGVGHARVDERHTYVWALDPSIFPPPEKNPWRETRMALSFGAGMKVRSPGPGSLFLDAHLDFLFMRDFEGAIIPVRLGYGIPIRRWGSI